MIDDSVIPAARGVHANYHPVRLASLNFIKVLHELLVRHGHANPGKAFRVLLFCLREEIKSHRPDVMIH